MVVESSKMSIELKKLDEQGKALSLVMFLIEIRIFSIKFKSFYHTHLDPFMQFFFIIQYFKKVQGKRNTLYNSIFILFKIKNQQQADSYSYVPVILYAG